MKKTQKKVLGLFGLGLVVATTVFAATLPGPEAQATSSITDTIIVRVIGEGPEVNVDGTEDETFINPEKSFPYDYAGVDSVVIKLEFKGKDDTTPQTFVLDTISGIDFVPGSGTIDINLDDYGYGEFKLIVEGYGNDGDFDSDIIDFTYIPLTATIGPNDDDGDATLTLDYDDDDDKIHSIGIVLIDENGNEVKPLSPITVFPHTKDVNIPFETGDLPAGKYTILITAYNENGDALYKPYTVYYVYSPEEVTPTVVPNTGSAQNGLNISQSDYLATGLIIFLTVGIGGAVFVMKGKKDQKKRR